jgi:hypothetical protein
MGPGKVLHRFARQHKRLPQPYIWRQNFQLGLSMDQDNIKTGSAGNPAADKRFPDTSGLRRIDKNNPRVARM